MAKDLKLIRVQRGNMILYLPEEAYTKLCKDYDRLKKALLAVCNENCNDCPMAAKNFTLPPTVECKIKLLFDPAENSDEAEGLLWRS